MEIKLGFEDYVQAFRLCAVKTKSLSQHKISTNECLILKEAL